VSATRRVYECFHRIRKRKMPRTGESLHFLFILVRELLVCPRSGLTSPPAPETRIAFYSFLEGAVVVDRIQHDSSH